jgi:hypothetical protein
VYKDYISVIAPGPLQNSNGPHPVSEDNEDEPDKHPRALGLFGCTNMETGLFKSQKVNGILGLFAKTDTVRNSPNFLDELFDVHQDNSKSFSLCLGTDGGFMTLGGYNVAKHMPGEEMQTVPFIRGSNYIVEVYQINVTNFLLGSFAGMIVLGHGWQEQQVEKRKHDGF